jgi:AbrB family looped-hinge helix DNA binding protein
MTMSKSSKVRVKRKGQVTIPSELRSKLDIQEGTLLEVVEREGAIVLTRVPQLEGGEVVGKESHKQLIDELDQLRRHWR